MDLTTNAIDFELSSKQLQRHKIAYNTVILPNFLVWTFCGKAQFPQIFGTLWKLCLFT